MKKLGLGECCEIVSGATPKSSVPEFWDGDIAWATPADLSDLAGAYIGATPRRLTAAGLSSCSAKILPPGSVLFSSRAPIGHVAINTVPMATNQGFKSFIPHAGVLDSKYLYHWLKFNKAYLQSLGNGATFKEISKAAVARVEIAVPALEEQCRVVALLDQAEMLSAKRRQSLAYLDELLPSVFLEMFGNEARRAVTTDVGLLHERGWRWVLLTEVAQLATGHTPDRKKPEYWNGEISWISLPEIRALDGKVALETALKTTPAGISNSSAVILPEGTVCFSRTASIGFVTRLGRPMATSQDFHNWIPGSAINADYLMTALRVSRPHLLGVSDGSIHKTIYQRVAASFRVLLPPKEVQDSFAHRLARLVEASALSRVAQEHADSAAQALAYRAFAGKL